jgi:hypothetical protein
MSRSRVRLVAIVRGAALIEVEYPRSVSRAERTTYEARFATWLTPARLGDLTSERVQKALGALRAQGIVAHKIQRSMAEGVKRRR